MEQTRGRLVLKSAAVYAPSAPFATSIIVDGGQIAWIGDDGGLTQQLLDTDHVVDAAGLLAAPAFFDAHATGSLAEFALADGVGAAQLFEPANDPASTLVELDAAGTPQPHSNIPAQPDRLDGSIASDDHVIDELRRGGMRVVVPAAELDQGVLARLSKAGVPAAVGSFGTQASPWEWMRQAVFGAEDGVSARAAFAACTRAGWRLAGYPDRGQLAVGTTAVVALWHAPVLEVQSPDNRVAAWSTDPRSGTPPLPDLRPGSELPVLAGMIHHGQLHAAGRQ